MKKKESPKKPASAKTTASRARYNLLFIVILTALFGLALGLLLLLAKPENYMSVIRRIGGGFACAVALFHVVTAYRLMRDRQGVWYMMATGILAVFIALLFAFPNEVFSILCGAYLCALSLYAFIVSSNKLRQIRRGIPALLIGLVLIVLGTDAFIKVVDFLGWFFIGLSALYLLCGSLFALIRTDKEVDEEEEKEAPAASAAQSPLHITVRLPGDGAVLSPAPVLTPAEQLRRAKEAKKQAKEQIKAAKKAKKKGSPLPSSTADDAAATAVTDDGTPVSITVTPTQRS